MTGKPSEMYSESDYRTSFPIPVQKKVEAKEWIQKGFYIGIGITAWFLIWVLLAGLFQSVT